MTTKEPPIFVVERGRIWEFTRDGWKDFVEGILEGWGEILVNYPAELMLRCGTPTVSTIAGLANDRPGCRFVLYPKQWPQYRWEMELDYINANS